MSDNLGIDIDDVPCTEFATYDLDTANTLLPHSGDTPLAFCRTAVKQGAGDQLTVGDAE